MALLMLFALVAGAGTALSPCVLPVLPAVLGAGVSGGRRRPLGVVTGLAVSFALATTASAALIDALGLPDDILRWAAIAVLAGFGALLLLPAAAARLEAWLQRVVPSPARVGGDGFGSGLVLGASLGLLYVPCAGPILGAVIVGAASQGFAAGVLAVALAYAAGSALVLYALILGGRRLADRLRPWRARVQTAVGMLMIAVAGLMAADVDTRFQAAIADELPAFLVNPTGGLEESSAVSSELAALRGAHGAPEVGEAEALAGERLPDAGPAPELAGTGRWFNTDAEELSIGGLTGSNQVVLVDFWTYTCINCLRTLPYLRAWHDRYASEGLTIVGVHTPEFAFERDAGNVARAISDLDISYPVVQDNEYATWEAFANQYWPAKYLIDAEGRVRYAHFGEGAYAATERAIRALLAEAGNAEPGDRVGPQPTEGAAPGVLTAETYLGADRAEGFVAPVRLGQQTFAQRNPAELPRNAFAYGGSWTIEGERATAGQEASLSLDFTASQVFLVLGSPARERSLELELDGRPLADRFAGEDVSGGAVQVSRHRLYRLVGLPRTGRHTLTLRFEPGISGYAFTFG